MSPKLKFELEGDGLPIRLDLFIRHEVPELSRTEVQRLIRSGAATVNGRTINTPSAKVDAAISSSLMRRAQPYPTCRRSRRTSTSMSSSTMTM